jgi:hypothetical protein
VAEESVNSEPMNDSTLTTRQSHIDEALTALHTQKGIWVTFAVSERVHILDEVRADMLLVADRWIAASLTAKGLATHTVGEAEEWLFLAAILRALRMVRQTLTEIQRDGRPRLPGPFTNLGTDQFAVRVFPRDPWDRLLFGGVTGHVWMQPNVTVEVMLYTQARVYRDTHEEQSIALVLGAGNASMLPVIDVLHKLLVEKQVVVLKPSPVNAYLGSLMEAGLRAFIRRGFLRIVYGGVEEAQYLCNHPLVDELHLTGSQPTFEAITFGSDSAAAQRKRDRTPLISKRFTCELGNVSPVIIIPGRWTEADIQEQAEQIVTWFVANAGFGCLTPRMIIQQRGWHGRERLVEMIGQILQRVELRNAYYPGASTRHAAFVTAHPHTRQIGQASGEQLPWTLIPDVDPMHTDDVVFTREAFCSIIAETALDSAGIVDFIEQAVTFANTTLWGTLNATLLVHPTSLLDPQVAAAVERAIAQLRYGVVTVNMAAYAAYYFQVMPWGGFPGHTSDDIQSGIGKVANFLMFERPQKSVVRGPFRKHLDPLRITSRRAHEFARRLAYFEASPSLWKLAGLIETTVRA